MRQLKLLMLAVFAMLALGAVASAVASAEELPEEKNNPSILVLGTGIESLEGTFTGGGSTLSTLNKKTIEGTADSATIKGCLKQGTSDKDTNLCHEIIAKFTGVKQGKVSCFSENKAGKKDGVETVLTKLDGHVADEKSISKELQPLIIFEVLGIEGEAELTINCGAVKEKVKGRIGCLLLPGLTEIEANVAKSVEVLCKASVPGDQETGTCEETKILCEELAKKPFEGDLGAGFEMASMLVHLDGSFNLMIFIDD